MITCNSDTGFGLQEVGSSTRHAVCGGIERSRHVFTSRGHSILVYISESYARSDAPAFILDYSGKGRRGIPYVAHGGLQNSVLLSKENICNFHSYI